MIKFRYFSLALLGIVATQPLAAQELPSATCMVETGPPQMGSLLVQDFLADQNVADPPAVEETRAMVIEAGRACLAKNTIPQEAVSTYLNVNFANVLVREFRKILLEAEIDLEPIDELVELLIADPDMDIAEYIDARPEIFEIPHKRVAIELGVSDDLVITWVAGYIGIRQKLVEAEREYQAAFSAP